MLLAPNITFDWISQVHLRLVRNILASGTMLIRYEEMDCWMNLLYPNIENKHSNNVIRCLLCLPLKLSSDRKRLFVWLAQKWTQIQKLLVYPQLSLHFNALGLCLLTRGNLKLYCAQMFECLMLRFVQLFVFWHGHISHCCIVLLYSLFNTAWWLGGWLLDLALCRLLLGEMWWLVLQVWVTIGHQPSSHPHPSIPPGRSHWEHTLPRSQLAENNIWPHIIWDTVITWIITNISMILGYYIPNILTWCLEYFLIL